MDSRSFEPAASWNRKSRRLMDRSERRRRARVRAMRGEQLEDRRVMATFTWTGGAGAGNTTWSNTLNWQGGIVPNDVDPTNIVAFDSAVVVAGLYTANNNLTLTSQYSIQINDTDATAGRDFTLTGNGINLAGITHNLTGGTASAINFTGTGLTLTGPASITNTAGQLNIAAPIALGGNALTETATGNTTITGVITGTAASSINFTGNSATATLNLNTANPAFDGTININRGVLGVGNAGALGTAVGGTFINFNNTDAGGNGTAIQLNSVNVTAEPIKFTSNGTGDRRTAMLFAGGAANTWGGPISLEGSGTAQFTINATAGVQTIAGGLTAGGGGFTGTTFFRGGGAGTGNITGVFNIPAGNFNRTDASIWTISSTGNSWAQTFIATGELRLGVANALPTGLVVQMGQAGTNSPTLNLNGFAQTVAGLTNIGTGAGNVTVTNGGAAQSLTINNASPVTFATSGTSNVVVSGAANLNIVKNGAGTFTLGGNNTFTGGVTINAGVLQLASTTALGTGNALTFGASSTGTLRLAGNNATITNLSTNATPGTPIIENASATPATLTTSGATSTTFAGNFQNGAGGGALSINKTGASGLSLSGNNSGLGGTVTIAAGTIFFTGVNASSAAATWNISASGATLATNSDVIGINKILPLGAVTGVAGAILRAGGSAVGTNAFEVGALGSNATFSGIIQNSPVAGVNLAVTKVGSGSWTLNGSTAHTYTGATTISAGTLLMNGTLATASTVTVQSGGTLGGTSTTGVVNINAGGTNSPGDTNATGINTVTGNYVENGNFVFQIGSPSGGTQGLDYDQVRVIGSGSVNLTGATLATAYLGTPGTFNPTLNQVYILIDNDGTSPADTIGTFAGLGEGATVTIDGKAMQLSYVGGDGNDVVLKSLTGPVRLYVDATFTGSGNVDGNRELAGFQTATIGVNAFASIDAALAANPGFSGEIIVNGGTYATATLTGGAVTLQLVQDLVVGGAELDVTIQSITGDANDAIVTRLQNTANANAIIEQGTFNGIISGSGGLIKTTAGTLTLSAANTYTAATTVNAGLLSLTGGANRLPVGTILTFGASSTGTVRLNGANQTVAGLATNATPGTPIIENGGGTPAILTINGTTTNSYAGAINNGGGGGSLALVKLGAGTQNLSGVSNYSGGTTIDDGVLGISADNNLGAIPGAAQTNVIIDGGTLQKNSNAAVTFAVNRQIAIGPGGATFNIAGDSNFNMASVIKDLGAGAGTVNVTRTSGNGIYVPQAQNTYTGGTHLISGSAVQNVNSVGSASTANLVSGPYGTGILFLEGATTRASSLGNGVIGNAVRIVADTTILTGVANSLTFDGPVTLMGTRAIIQQSAGAVNLTGVISSNAAGDGLTLGAGSTGALTLTGANNYSGPTTVLGGTLVAGAANTLPATAVIVGTGANTGNLTVNFDQTIPSLAVRSNSANNNTITIAAGADLNVTGTGGSLSIGASPAADNQTTKAIFTGAGTLNVNNAAANVEFGLANTNENNAQNNTTVDMTGLGSFVANVTNVRVGFANRNSAVVSLSNTSNSITADTLSIGDSNNLNVGSPISLTLGTGTNVIQVTTLNIGIGKGTGSMAFASQAPGSPGTLTLTGKTGGASTANINIAVNTTVNTAATIIGDLDLRGHVVTVQAGALVIGSTNQNGGAGGGGIDGSLSFDAGTFSAATVSMANKSGTATGATVADLNIGGGTFTVTGATFRLALHSGTATATGTLNLTGGTLVSNAPLTDGGTAGAITVVNLLGGTLNMTGKTVGGATLIDTLNIQSGGIQNWAQTNNGAALTKNGTGTLTISGTNTFTGGFTAATGDIVLNGSMTAALTMNAGTTLTGTGATGPLTVSSGATQTLGLTPNSAGVVSVTGNYVENGTYNFEITTPSGGTPGVDYDGIKVLGGGSVNIGATAALNISYTGAPGTFNPGLGQVYLLVDNDGTSPADTIGTFPGFTEGMNVVIDGKTLKFSYIGGDGNDVTLTSLAGPVSLYVNDEWTSPGAVDGNLELAGVQSATVGINAFASVDAALAAFPGFTGDIIVNGGVYATTNLAGGGNVNLQLVQDLVTAGETNVTFQNITGDAGDSITTRFHGAANADAIFEQGTFNGVIGGAGNISKTTIGALTLTAANTYSGGTTTLAGGTLTLSGGNNRLPVGTTIAFTGTSTLDVGATSQTASTMTFPNTTMNATVLGSGGTLTLNGAANLEIGPGGLLATAQTTTLDMSGLTNFNFNAPANTFRVGLKVGATNTPALGNVSVVTLAQNNTITAGSLIIGDVAGSSDGGVSILHLGQTNLINASTITVAFSGRSDATLDFNSALVNPSATFRGTAGGANPVTTWQVGWINQFSGAAQLAFAANVSLTTGTTDALVTNMLVGRADPVGGANRNGTLTATFAFGAGTVNVTNMTIGQFQGTGTVTATMAANGTVSVNNAAGTLTVSNLLLGEKTTTATGGTQTVTGTLTAANGGTINLPNGVNTGAGTGVMSVLSGGIVNVTNGIDAAAAGGTITVNVDEGTMNVAGGMSVNNLRVGNMDANSGSATLTVSSGAVNVGVAGVGTLDIGLRTINVSPDQAAVVGNANFTNAASVNINVGAMRMGQVVGAPSGEGGAIGNLLLSNVGTNDIFATTLVVSDSSDRGNGFMSTITLGSTSNAFHIDTVDIGARKGAGQILNPSNASLLLEGKVPGSQMNLDLAASVDGTGVVGIGTIAMGTGVLTANLSTFRLGVQNTGAGTATGTLTFTNGSVTATSVALGTGTQGRGIINQNGGAFTVNGNVTTGTGIGTLNLTAGTFTVNGGLSQLAAGAFTSNQSGGNLIVTGTVAAGTGGTFVMNQTAGISQLGGMTVGAGTSTVNLDNGTMTVTGDFGVDNLRVGLADNIASALANLTVAGGAVAIGSGTSHNIDIGRRTANNTNSSNGTADFSGATSVAFNVANLRVGTMTQNSTAGASQVGLLRLSAAGPNTVVADAVLVADATNAADQSAVTSEIVLGGGTNDFDVTNFTIGGIKSTGRVSILPGGSFDLTGKAGPGVGNLFIGRRTQDTAANTAGTLNLANASAVNIDVAVINLGQHVSGAGALTGQTVGTFVLPTSGASTSTLRADSILLGDSPDAANTTPTSSMVLGGGVTNINTNTFTVGGQKARGSVTIAPGGTLNLVGKTTTTANFSVGNNSTPGTGTTGSGVFDMTGGTFNGTLGAVLAGFHTGGGTGTGTGTITMAAGLVTADSLTLSNSDTAASAGTLNLNGGIFAVNGLITNGANGIATINHNGGTLRFNTLTKAAGTFNYNWNAGTIQNNPGQNLVDTNVNIQLLGLGTHNIQIDGGQTGTFTSTALLQNSGSFTKSGDGLLLLQGSNSFTGGVNINAGTVRLENAGALNAAGVNTVTFGPSSTGTLHLNGNSITIAGLNSSVPVGTPLVENANPTPVTLTINNAGANTYGGVLQDGAGGGGLTVRKIGAGTLNLNGSGTSTIQNLLIDGGALGLQSGTVNVTNNIIVGDTASGNLNISGGSLNNVGGGGVFSVGNNSGVTAVVTQTGGSVNTGSRELWISQGATANATWNMSAGNVLTGNWTAVGRGGNNGNLNISGGVWNTTVNNISIGSFAGAGVGQITVSGSGQLLANNDIYVGESGNGTLTVNGGTVQSGRLFVGTNGTSTGNMNLNGGVVQLTAGGGQGITVANAANSIGTVTQTGGNVTTGGKELWVSQGANANGTWNMSGGNVTVSNWTAIGRAGNNGKVNLSGTAIWNTTVNNASIGSFGGQGVGTVTVSGSAQFLATNDIYVGESGNGTLTVNGGTVQGGRLFVGTNGGSVGNMNLNGGTVQLTAGGGQGITVANAANSTGTVTQTGGAVTTGGRELWVSQAANAVGLWNMSGGTVTVSNWTAIGRGGNNGTVNLSGNAIWNTTVNNASIGSFGGQGVGAVTVSGSAQFLATNNIYVGEGGTGTLTLNSGTVTGANIIVGLNGGSVGNMFINGGTASLTAGGGQGWIVANAANSTGTVTQTGGTVTTGGRELWVSQGANAVGVWNISGGTVTVNNWTAIGRAGNNGTVNLSGTGVWNTTVNNLSIGSFNGQGVGTVNVSGNAQLLTTNGVYVGESGRGRLNITGGTVTGGFLNVGRNNGSVGVYTQSGGVTAFGGAPEDSRIGNAAGSYGYARVSGGTMTWNGNFQVGAAGVGVMEITGGTVNSPVANFPVIGRFGGGVGQMTVSGGSFNHTNPASFLIVGEDGTGALNVTGTGSVNLVNQLRIGHTATGVGQVNLLGGTLTTPTITDNGGVSNLNFRGGTLRTNASSATYLQGLDAVEVYAPSGTIDTNGQTITVAQQLQAPPGNGVATIPVATGGAGYIGVPQVQITGGGGLGASAIAIVSGGIVTGIQIMSPGFGYTSTPTVVLVGGGATTAATLGAATLSANVSGSLNKIGAGILNLTAANTYTGGTNVQVGTLRVNNTTGSGTGTGTVTVQSGATLGGDGAISGAVNVLSGGTLAPGNSPGDIATGNLTLSSGAIYNVEINGTAPGTGYDQTIVTGTVSLSGATLTGSSSISPAPGTVFVIIVNDGADPVSGFFANAPAEFAPILIGGVGYHVTYTYNSLTNTEGTGNDVALIRNRAPVAIAGSYTISEGDDLTLDGSLSSDPDGDSPLTYRWDVDGDGDFDENITGVNPTVTWATLQSLGIDDGPQTRTIRVEANDGLGGVSVSTGTLNFQLDNTPPTAGISGPTFAAPFELVTFTLTATDPSDGDTTAGFTWDIDWDGDLVPDEQVTGPSGTTVSHAFGGVGNFTITVTATDDDGGVSAPVTHTIEVTPVFQDSEGNVVARGLDGFDDRIVFSLASGGRVQVRWENSMSLAKLAPLTYGPFTLPSGAKLIATGSGGNDNITTSVTGVPVSFDGGAGNDYMAGGTANDSFVGGEGNDRVVAGNGNDYIDLGSGDDSVDAGNDNDTIFGGAGIDTLNGGAGNDLMDGGDDKDTMNGGAGMDIMFGGGGGDTINGSTDADVLIGGDGDDSILGDVGRDILLGGSGKDTLTGGNDDDVLAGGLTKYDNYSPTNAAAVQALLNEWNSSGAYATRVANLKSGGGAAGGNRLNPGAALGGAITVVNDDGFNDTLNGGTGSTGGTDWFLASTAASGINKDTTDRITGETLN